MKKLIFIVAFVLVGCSKEDEPTVASLSGVYHIESIQGDSFDDCSAEESLTFSESKMIHTQFFYEDGVCQSVSINFDYTLNGSTINLQGPDYLVFTSSGTVISQNQIKLITYYEGDIVRVAFFSKD